MWSARVNVRDGFTFLIFSSVRKRKRPDVAPKKTASMSAAAIALLFALLAASTEASITGCMTYYAVNDCSDPAAVTTCGTFTSGDCGA